MKKTMGWVLMMLIGNGLLYGQDSLYTVSGKIFFEKEGNIYVSMTTESQFMNKDASPTRRCVLSTSADSTDTEWVTFEFDSLVAGEYVISAFQDVNGNGKLDMGWKGPKEPYGFSGPRPRFMPKFNDLKFEVGQSVCDMMINLE